MGVVGQCFELAAVQLDVYGIAEVLWKIIAFKREAFFGLVYTVQQSSEFCECRELLGRDGIQLRKDSEGTFCRLVADLVKRTLK